METKGSGGDVIVACQFIVCYYPCRSLDALAFKKSNGNIALMNVMCDVTQFVVVVLVPNTEHFIQYVLLKFGICHLVILDDGSSFKGVFRKCVNRER